MPNMERPPFSTVRLGLRRVLLCQGDSLRLVKDLSRI